MFQQSHRRVEVQHQTQRSSDKSSVLTSLAYVGTERSSTNIYNGRKGQTGTRATLRESLYHSDRVRARARVCVCVCVCVCGGGSVWPFPCEKRVVLLTSGHGKRRPGAPCQTNICISIRSTSLHLIYVLNATNHIKLTILSSVVSQT